MLLLAHAWASDWVLESKVTFDGITKIITVHPEVTTLDIREDLYSSWVDWLYLRDHSKFLPALRYTGLDPIGAGTFTGDSYFLINGWKLSINLQKVKVTGVLYSDDYDTAFYTDKLVAQYPATVAALVNSLVSYQNVVTGIALTAEQTAAVIRDALAVELARIDAKISSRATLAHVAAFSK